MVGGEKSRVQINEQSVFMFGDEESIILEFKVQRNEMVLVLLGVAFNGLASCTLHA